MSELLPIVRLTLLVGGTATLGALPVAFALAWVLAKPAVSAPIVGASKAGHLDDAIAALDIVLSDSEIERLEAPYVPHAVVGFQ